LHAGKTPQWLGDSRKQAVIGILTGGRTLKPYSFNQSLLFFFNLFRSRFPVFIRQFCWPTLAALFIFNMSLNIQPRAAISTSGQLLGTCDEIRFGTTLGSVTAISEPSTGALMAGSLAVLVMLRRRRSGQPG